MTGPLGTITSLYNSFQTTWRSKPTKSTLDYHYESLALDDVSERDDPSLESTPYSISPILPTSSRPKPSRTPPSRSALSRPFKLILVLLLMIPICYYLPKLITILHLYTDSGSTEKFPPSYVPNAKSLEHTVPAVSISNLDATLDSPSNPNPNSLTYPPLAALQKEMETRLISLGLPAANDPIRCTSVDSAASLERYDYLRVNSQSPYASKVTGRTFIALNLFMSGSVLPSITRSLLTLADFLGPSSLFISIFENGSWDATPAALAHFAAVLTAAGVPHHIVHDDQGTPGGVDRIDQLAVYRNVAMAPLYESVLDGNPNAANVTGKGETPFQNVVFINDVYFCPVDVLELLHVRLAQDAHATCGLDYRWRNNPLEWLTGTGPKFYDNWVSRTLNGNTFRSRLDLFTEIRDGLHELFRADFPGARSDNDARKRFGDARVLPVYSCWNGMIVLDARPFLGRGLGWKAGDGESGGDVEKVRFRPGRREKNECPASECKLVAKDFWTLGFDRWVLVPYVRTTYVPDLYNQASLEDLTDRARGRWRSPPPFQTLSPRTDTSSPSIQPPAPRSQSPSRKSKWTYADSPHPSRTPWDEFSPSLTTPHLNITNADSDSKDNTVWEGEGEERDLIAWHRVQGPVTVVCWPYHKVGNIEWWWTRIKEKVKSPLQGLR